MATLLHFAPLRLEAGSVIVPGNWGRILKRYSVGNAAVHWLLARELVFEQIRSADPKFAAKPSRLSSCFALPARTDAEAYRSRNDQNFMQVLHEIEIVDPKLPQHTGWLSHLDHKGGPFLDPTRMQAIEYWSGNSGDPSHGQEIVTTSGLRVLKCLE